jgi:glucosyl-3-phosphoglycerate phosphatase
MQREVAKHCDQIHQALSQGPIDTHNERFLCFPVTDFDAIQQWNNDTSRFQSVKMVHFVRHGQGYHNARHLEVGYECECGRDPPRCPYVSDDLIDARLTATGQQEATLLQPITATLVVERILVSPLSRALETACLAFATDVHRHVPMTCYEVFREQIGQHSPDKRRATQQVAGDFARVDFEHVTAADDELWTDKREAKRDLIARTVSGLQTIEAQSEVHLALVGHSSWLLACFAGAMTCYSSFDDYVQSQPPVDTKSPEWAARYWFRTGELRSVVLAFEHSSKCMYDAPNSTSSFSILIRAPNAVGCCEEHLRHQR